MKGELASFARAVSRLHRDLRGEARLQPLEPNIAMTLQGDGKGHITVVGTAQNHFERKTQLVFEFAIDQTYLEDIANSLNNVDAD